MERISFDIVVHTQYGGFGLTDEMLRILRQVKGAAAFAVFARQDNDKRRKDPDLVTVVRDLTEEVKAKSSYKVGLSLQERFAMEERLLGGLEVKSVTVDITIDDHDGKERVIVNGNEV